MKLAVLVALIFVATLVYGSLPITTNEFLQMKPAAALRMLNQSVRSQARLEQVEIDEQQIAQRASAALLCVRRAAARGEGDLQAVDVIDRCSELR